jgi:hypothetical protein
MNRGRSDRALQNFGRGNEAYRILSDKSDLNWVRRLRQVEMFSLIVRLSESHQAFAFRQCGMKIV